jgi:hypothetical protein
LRLIDPRDSPLAVFILELNRRCKKIFHVGVVFWPVVWIVNMRMAAKNPHRLLEQAQQAAGMIAEDVAQVDPNLAIRNGKGEIENVRYNAVNAMLLNEFLKEHRKVQEQEATITQLKKDFGATIAQLTARLYKQAAEIHKVSAQLEVNKPAPQTVLSNQ